MRWALMPRLPAGRAIAIVEPPIRSDPVRCCDTSTRALGARPLRKIVLKMLRASSCWWRL
jgi:hypothetical protein